MATATNQTPTASTIICLDETDVGCRREWSHVERKRFNIHNFADQAEARGTFIPNLRFKAHGYDWELLVYPRGHVDSDEDVEHVSYLLELSDSEKSVNAMFAVSSGKCKSKGNDSGECRFSSETFLYWGQIDFTKRSDLLDPSQGHLINDALAVDVDIQVQIPAPTEWQPKTRNKESFLSSLWLKPQDADTRIVVQGRSIPAHKLVLQHQARQIFDLVSVAEADDSVLTVDDVSHESFKAVLCYIYTGNLSDNVMKKVEVTKEILKVADRFGCVELKLKMEYNLAMNLLTPINLVDLFMDADALSCALLKESAMNMFRKCPHAVRQSEGWTVLKESPQLWEELVDALLIPNILPRVDDSVSEGTIDKLTVCGLRKRLECDGLELDGTRDTLIKRLKSNTRDKNE